MHSSFQKNKFHHHATNILEIRWVGTGGGKHRVPPPRSSATILDQEGMQAEKLENVLENQIFDSNTCQNQKI